MFIDDDETAPADWVASMTRQIEQHGADCLFAPVSLSTEVMLRTGCVNWNPLFPPELKTATKRARVVGRTGNSVLRKAFIDRHGLQFDLTVSLRRRGPHFFDLCRRAGARTIAVEAPVLQEGVCSHYHRLDQCCRSSTGAVRPMPTFSAA